MLEPPQSLPQTRLATHHEVAGRCSMLLLLLAIMAVLAVVGMLAMVVILLAVVLLAGGVAGHFDLSGPSVAWFVGSSRRGRVVPDVKGTRGAAVGVASVAVGAFSQAVRHLGRHRASDLDRLLALFIEEEEGECAALQEQEDTAGGGDEGDHRDALRLIAPQLDHFAAG